MSLNDSEKKHPSYGLVQFNRINGRFDNLFGTNVESSTAIALRIKKASVNRSLNSNWYHEASEILKRPELVSAHFSRG